MSNMLSLIISSLALIVACGVLIVHRQKHIETRHAEIIRLQRLLISEFSNHRQRMISILTNLEFTKLELRKFPEDDDKYSLIEKVTSLISRILKIKSKHEIGLKITENTDSRSINTSRILIDMQKRASDAQSASDDLLKLEEDVLNLLKHIQEHARTPKEEHT